MNSWFHASDLWFPLLVMAGASFAASRTEELRLDPMREQGARHQFWRDPRLLAGAAAGLAAPYLPGRAGEFSLLAALGLLGSYVSTETIRLRSVRPPSESPPSLAQPSAAEEPLRRYTLEA